MRAYLAALLVLSTTACTTSPPDNVDNLCAIFREKSGWYEDAAEAQEAWGSPIPVLMAIMHQESNHQHGKCCNCEYPEQSFITAMNIFFQAGLQTGFSQS